MRIVCDGCGTRYSVPDDKVSGRLCRFRCRKCNRVILLRGDLVEASAAQGATADRDAEGPQFPTGEATDPGAAPFGEAGVEAPESATPSLTAERSENSVLFSLDNLKALATSGAAPSRNAAVASADEGSGRGFAAGRTASGTGARRESSGLIDIRALAARELQASTPSGAGEVAHFHAAPLQAEVPNFAPIPTMTPPIFVPPGMPGGERQMPRWAMALVGVGALATITAGAAIALIVYVNPVRPTHAGTAASPGTSTSLPTSVAPGLASNAAHDVVALGGDPAKGSAPPSSVGGIRGPGAGAGPAPDPGATKTAAAPPASSPARTREHAAGRDRHVSDGNAARAARTTPPVTASATRADANKLDVVATNDPSRPTDKTKRTAAGDLLGELMDDATPNERGAARPVTRPDDKKDETDLPATLEQRDVKSGMDAVKQKVAACYAQYHVPGMALVAAQIAPSGRIQSATVQGALAGTPTADCVLRAVKGASFRRFKGTPISISYPYVLR